MWCHFTSKRNNYIVSRRTYEEDYSNIISKDIDMTLSGTFLGEYPDLNINYKSFDNYPGPHEIEELINTIKKKFLIKERIVLGAGTNGILQNLIRVYIKGKKDNLITPYYTFNQAEYATTSCGGYTKRVLMDNYDVDLEKIKNSIDSKSKLVYICNPNNPTGKYIEANEIIKLCNSIRIPVIIDESAIEFSHKKSLIEYKKLPKNLIILRSFSKAYGLANLRLGYMVCDKEIEDRYIKNTTTNEFSGFSAIISKRMIDNIKFVEKNVKIIEKERDNLIKELKKLNIKLVPTCTNTIMTETKFDKSFINKLDKNNVSVVPVQNPDGQVCIRIAVQDKETNRKFIDILKEVL